MTVEAPNTTLYGLAFSTGGNHLVAAYSDGLRLWNARTTRLEGTVMTNPESIPITSVAYSGDGNTIAAGRADGAVELWDSHARKQLPKSALVGHASQILGVAFGLASQLATGGIDETMRLWDTSTGLPSAAPLMRSDTITSVAVSPDGRLAASGTLDGTVLLAPAMVDPSQLCDKLATNMSRKQWRDWVSPAVPYITLCPGLPIPSD
jgi:WD40 repeat protein